ncbi:protein mono-ADP-ribosyltransferase PARP15-like [Gigantopelta aegis]|uniref:protein mono-ADP-ribosyltransferase PARP15-like n=1 Tax=Gigantopelta aegis TaxID=1735272 RepID=UPI001B88D5A9|nr:protein mono-ADP-ribosyltransferase PARP15-like [Gigantopelta aegis]
MAKDTTSIPPTKGTELPEVFYKGVEPAKGGSGIAPLQSLGGTVPPQTHSTKQRRNLKMGIVLSRDKITEQQVDAIVNCILSDIQLSDCDGSSTRIDIKVERHRNMEIYSTPLHMWSYEGEKILKTLVMSCFKKAEGARHTSIAFATHTMAILHYALDVVARVFFAAIVKFAEINPNHLQKVVLVVPPSAKAFNNTFDKERLKHVFESNIQLNSVLDQTPLHFPRKRTYRRIRRSGVSYIVGDLIKQNVDVIVNSTGNELYLSSGQISQIVAEAAGPSIQEECARNYPEGIESWDVARLWRYFSIPPDVAARVFFDTTVQFAERNPYYLQTVVLVAVPSANDFIKAFDEERLKHVFESNIQLNSTLDQTPLHFPRKRTYRRIRRSGVSFVVGDLVKQNVDVIVNSTGNWLYLGNGPLSKIVLKAAGPRIQQECQINYPNGIKSWGVAVTSGGNINCQQIYHISLKYKNIMNRLLEKADSTGHTSIAFPVLGTGLIQYPSDKVVKSLYETAMAFHGNHLKNILFVVHPKDFANRKAFEKEELNHIQLEEHILDEIIRRGAACSISLVKGDIANQNVDVIINSTSPKLDSMGGSLARAGGDTLLQEYKTKYPNGIKSGEIAAFREQIDDCFLKAASDGVTSMAFPVLGTGVDKYPVDVVSKVIFESFDDFNNNNRNTSLQDKHHDEFMDLFTLCALLYPEQEHTEGISYHHDMVEIQTEETRQSWNDMSKGEYFKLIQLPTQTIEYKSVEQNFKATLSSDVDINKIERVQNKTLRDQYSIMKRDFQEKNRRLQNERTLWHGTSSESTNSINTCGFNRSFCGKNATAYGNGTYFATNSSYSADDTYSPPDSEGYKYVYQALVLTGDFTEGRFGIRVPPQKPYSSSHIRFDSVVDRKQNPNMFVIFSDTQAYPEYLITFSQDPRSFRNLRQHTVPSTSVGYNCHLM